MALFFDSAWFDARLAAAHLSRGDAARALGISDSEIAEVWKDQRELSARDVSILAALLAAVPKEVADRAGISTPIPKPETSALPADFSARLQRVESALIRIEALLIELKNK